MAGRRQCDALKSRARAIRGEFEDPLAAELAALAGHAPDDPDARLAAALLVAAWGVAYLEGHRVFQAQGNESAAQAAFLSVIDLTCASLSQALSPTSP